MSKEALVLSNVQNEGADLYVRHFEGPVEFGIASQLGLVMFRSIGDRSERQFFIEIHRQRDDVSEVAVIEAPTAEDVTAAIASDGDVSWFIEQASYNPAESAGRAAA